MINHNSNTPNLIITKTKDETDNKIITFTNELDELKEVSLERKRINLIYEKNSREIHYTCLVRKNSMDFYVKKDDMDLFINFIKPYLNKNFADQLEYLNLFDYNTVLLL